MRETFGIAVTRMLVLEGFRDVTALQHTNGQRPGDLISLRTGAILAGVRLILGILGIALLIVGLSIAFGPLIALALGVALLASATILGLIAARRLPVQPLAATTRRMQADKQRFEEHLG